MCAAAQERFSLSDCRGACAKRLIMNSAAGTAAATTESVFHPCQSVASFILQ